MVNMDAQYARLSLAERAELYNGEATRLYKRWASRLIDGSEYRQKLVELKHKLGL